MPLFRVNVEADVRGQAPVRATRKVVAYDADDALRKAITRMTELDDPAYDEAKISDFDRVMLEVKRLGERRA